MCCCHFESVGPLRVADDFGEDVGLGEAFADGVETGAAATDPMIPRPIAAAGNEMNARFNNSPFCEAYEESLFARDCSRLLQSIR